MISAKLTCCTSFDTYLQSAGPLCQSYPTWEYTTITSTMARLCRRGTTRYNIRVLIACAFVNLYLSPSTRARSSRSLCSTGGSLCLLGKSSSKISKGSMIVRFHFISAQPRYVACLFCRTSGIYHCHRPSGTRLFSACKYGTRRITLNSSDPRSQGTSSLSSGRYTMRSRRHSMISCPSRTKVLRRDIRC